MPNCINITFSRDGLEVVIVADDQRAYFATSRVRNLLLSADVRQLAELLGAPIALAKMKDGRTVCDGFHAKPERELQTTTGDDDSTDYPRPRGATPANQAPAERKPRRVVLDRYGLAIEVRVVAPAAEGKVARCEAIAYPVMARGAISPVGTTVRNWTPELLDALNQTLGATYTLEHFGLAPIEDDGMPF